jgi:hypothetical protein
MNHVGNAPQLKLDVGGHGMFDDVGNALLHDPVEGRFDVRRQSSFNRAVHADVQPSARSHPIHKELEGREET